MNNKSTQSSPNALQAHSLSYIDGGVDGAVDGDGMAPQMAFVLSVG